MIKNLFFALLSLNIVACSTYQYSNDPFLVGMRWFDRGNFDLARQYWQPLADKGDCDGQNGMALVLYRENLKSSDASKIKQSLDYLRKSADQGNYKSLSALGDLNYCEGDTKRRCTEYGTKPNASEALKFYILALDRAIYDYDKKYNQQMVDQLGSFLDKAKIETARQKAKNWVASPGQCTPRKGL